MVILVEGASDRIALQALAHRRERDLAADGVEVLAMGGITNLAKHLDRHRAHGVEVAGLYDTGEKSHVEAALARAGLSGERFFGCEPDLEYELIRALGVPVVEDVIAAQGELRSLRLLAGMPAQRDWPSELILHRFLGSKGGRKARYARLFVEALDLTVVPAPLDAVLEVCTPV